MTKEKAEFLAYIELQTSNLAKEWAKAKEWEQGLLEWEIKLQKKEREFKEMAEKQMAAVLKLERQIKDKLN